MLACAAVSWQPLAKQADEGTTTLLRDALRDPEKIVRIEALRVLQHLMETAGPTSPRITKLGASLRDAVTRLSTRAAHKSEPALRVFCCDWVTPRSKRACASSCAEAIPSCGAGPWTPCSCGAE